MRRRKVIVMADMEALGAGLVILLCLLTSAEAQRVPPGTKSAFPGTPAPKTAGPEHPFPGGIGGIPPPDFTQGRIKALPKTKPSTAQQNVSFYFVFAQMWPNGYCMASTPRNRCDRLPLHFPDDMWTVRGLWVAIQQSGKHLRYCKKANRKSSPVPIRAMKHHVPDAPHMSSQMAVDMDRIWPALEPGQVPEDRWAQEWQTHGVCTALGEEGYFGMILNLHQQFSLYNILGSAGIYPDDIYTFRAATMKSAIRQVHGFSAELFCRRRRLSANGRFAYVNILQEIHFCFDVDLQPIDCPARNASLPKITIQQDRPFPCAFDVLYPKYWQAVMPLDPKIGGGGGGGTASRRPASPGPGHVQVVVTDPRATGPGRTPTFVVGSPAVVGGGHQQPPLVVDQTLVGGYQVGLRQDPLVYVPAAAPAPLPPRGGQVIVVEPRYTDRGAGGAGQIVGSYQPPYGGASRQQAGPSGPATGTGYGTSSGYATRTGTGYATGTGYGSTGYRVQDPGPGVYDRTSGYGGARSPQADPGGYQRSVPQKPSPFGGGPGGGGGPRLFDPVSRQHPRGGGGFQPDYPGGGHTTGRQFSTFRVHQVAPKGPKAGGGFNPTGRHVGAAAARRDPDPSVIRKHFSPDGGSHATHDPFGLSPGRASETGDHVGVVSPRSHQDPGGRSSPLGGGPVPKRGSPWRAEPASKRGYGQYPGQMPIGRKSAGPRIAGKPVPIDANQPRQDISLTDNLAKRLGDEARAWFDPVLPQDQPTDQPPAGTTSPSDAHLAG